MAIRDYFKVSRKTFVNPSGWVGWDSLKAQTSVLRDGLKSAFTVAKPQREETFEEATKRLELTEDDIKNTIFNYRLTALSFLILAILAFAYAFFLLFRHGTITGWLLGFAVSALFGSQAFKYDFWAFQMRRRQLGLTFTDWKRSILGETGRDHD